MQIFHFAGFEGGFGFGQINLVKSHTQGAMMHAMVPFGMNIAKTLHVKYMAGRREAGFDPVALQDQLRDAACAAMIGGGEVNLRQLQAAAIGEIVKHRFAVPRHAIAIIIAVTEKRRFVEIARRP